MPTRYVIIGGGFAAAAALEGIRAHDLEGSIVVLSRENHMPYRRPPLTRLLATPDLALERLPIHPEGWYAEHRVEVALRREVVEIEPDARRVWDDRGRTVDYDELLIATGMRPRRLRAEGAEVSAVRYFRDLEDYFDLQTRLARIQHVTCIGGGIISLGMAAALRQRGLEVTLVFPDEYLLPRLLPRELGLMLVEQVRGRGVEVVSNETLVRIDEQQGFVHARTQGGDDLTTQLVLVDQGAEPASDLGEVAGLDLDDGIVVDEFGRTSREHVWAAGDVAEFPYRVLGQLMRLEGVDHAREHGLLVGANMAGAAQAYDHMPLQWFEVFDLRFEGVGALEAQGDTELVWVDPGREGVVFYLREDVVRGVLTCGMPGRGEWARSLVRTGRATSAAERAALTAASA